MKRNMTEEIRYATCVQIRLIATIFIQAKCNPAFSTASILSVS